MYRIHPSIMGLLGPMAAQPPAPQKQRCPTLPHGTDHYGGFGHPKHFAMANWKMPA